MPRVLEGLAWLGQELARGAPRLALSRIAGAAFLFGALVLTVPEQTRDLMAELPDKDLARDAFLFGVFVWCFVLWFWARWALNLECGVDPPLRAGEMGQEVRWWLTVAGFGVAVFCLWQAPSWVAPERQALPWFWRDLWRAGVLLGALLALGQIGASWRDRQRAAPPGLPAGRRWDAQVPRVLALLAAAAAAYAANRGTGLASIATIWALVIGVVVLLLTSFRHRLAQCSSYDGGAWGVRAAGVIVVLLAAWTAWQGGPGSWAFIRAILALLAVAGIAAAWVRSGPKAPLRWLQPDQRWAAELAAQRKKVGLDSDGGVRRRHRNDKEAALFACHYGTRGWFGRAWLDLRAAPLGQGTALALVLASVLFCAVVWIAPDTTTPWLGAAGTAMLSLAALTTLTSVVVHLLDRSVPAPVGTLALLLGFAAVELGADNHAIRSLAAMDPAPRDTLRQALGKWIAECAPADPAQPVRTVLVATAGGASRAALWTTTVLDALEKADPALPARLVGISAVSGGSLGAAAWTALLADAGADCRTPPAAAQRDTRAARARGLIDQDHLAAPMAGFLATDPLWFLAGPLGLPFAWLGWTPPDRATGLERSFETAWARVGATPKRGLVASFHDPWRAPDRTWSWRRPLLFLNGTHQETGLPIVTAPVRLALPDMLASYDYVNVASHDLRLSTAVLNSARFPYVTPSGGLRAPEGRRGNLVDGGYFDNQGSATLSDVAAALMGVLREKQPDRTLHLMVVQISSDPDRRPGELLGCNGLAEPPETAVGQRERALLALERAGDSPSGLDATLGPILAVAATQSAHTVRSSVNLARVFCSNTTAVRPPEQVTTEFTHFILCPDKDRKITLPLNWVLPGTAQRWIAGTDRTGRVVPPNEHAMGTEACGNAAELERFRAWVALPPPPQTAAAPAPGR